MEELSIIVGEKRQDFFIEESLISVFKTTTSHFPEKISLYYKNQSITYQELDNWSDAVAHQLQSKGLKSGDACLIWWDRGLELHVAILAILKCGATYVPLDFEMPEERVLSVMEDIKATFIITSHPFSHSCTVINDLNYTPEDTSKFIAVVVEPDTNAYVLFTSGTTGKPKGIPITNRNICHFIRSENSVLNVNSSDKVYQGFSVSFDMWCEETWISYLVGASLWIADSVTSKSIDELSTILFENEITVLHAVPSLLAVMETIDLPKLRLINAGGEACTPLVLNKWSNDNRKFYNSYGPTETTVSASIAKLTKGEIITIGKPLPNYGLAIVDENRNPILIGNHGELVISGIGVSNGYLNLEALTKEKFIPKNDSLNALPGAIIYRTGDAAYMDEHKNIHFIGRIDSQVKLRGFRIELEEIESLLNDQENVLQAAVALKKDSNDQEQLTAYVVLKKDTFFVFSESKLKENLQQQLPSYMIPLVIMVLEELPRLASGKIDRKLLPIPENYLAQNTAPIHILETDDMGTKAIKILHKIFIKEDITLENDFFTDLSGHSLLAGSFVSLMRSEAKVSHASLKDIYQYRPLSALVSKWESTVKEESKEPRVFNTVLNSHYYLCWFAQSVALILIFGFLATEIFIPYLAYYFTLLNTENYLESAISALLMFCLIPPVFIGLGIAVKWVVIGKYKEGKYPLWGTYYFRWWFVKTFNKIVPTQFFNGTPLYPAYLKMLGVKIKADAQLSSFTMGAEDLITIKKDVSISSNVILDNAVIEDGFFILSRITIGNHGYVGSSSILEGNTTIEDWGELQDLSLLQKNKTIGYAQIWKGSPSQLIKTRKEEELLYPLKISKRRLFAYKTTYSLLLLLFPLFILVPLIPTIIAISELDNAAGYFEFYYLWITPLLSIIYLFLFASFNVILSRLLQKGIQPGEYPVYGRFYVKKWMVEQLNSLSLIVLHPMYASVFISSYFRALGAKIGKDTEISTASNVTHPLLEIGTRSFIADAVTLGESDVRGQRLFLEKTVIENNSFVGNSALIPQGYQLSSNMLIGVLSVPPSDEQLTTESFNDWFGSPAIGIPRRQESELFDETQTFSPSKKTYYTRATIEFIRIILPQTVILICSIYFIAYTSELMATKSVGMILGLLPFYYLFFMGIPVLLIPVLMKWILIGKYKESSHPMWSLQVWKTEMITSTYEALCIPFLLEYLKGTPWLPVFLRLFGVKIGTKVMLNTSDFTEFDMVTIGNDCALNEDCGPQTHLFEDRVMKIGKVEIGNRVTIGSRSIILYNTKIEDDVNIGDLSLVMKGEIIQKETQWVGSPISEK